jgi:hypothetical protein
MCGWFSRPIASASVRNRDPSSPGSTRDEGEIIFRATTRPGRTCQALYTTPMPPPPSHSRLS